jgi:hypothetical protein
MPVFWVFAMTGRRKSLKEKYDEALDSAAGAREQDCDDTAALL